jgi:hypothetical protein
MDLLRFKFRPQVECEMRCAQSQDLRAASPINLTGLEPAILFFFPLTVGLQTLPPPSKNKPASSQPAFCQPGVSETRQVPVS